MEKILPKELLNKYFLKNYKKIEFDNIDSKVVFCYAAIEKQIHQFKLKCILQKKYIFYTIRVEGEKFISEKPRGGCIYGLINNNKYCASNILEIHPNRLSHNLWINRLLKIDLEIIDIPTEYCRLWLDILPDKYVYNNNMSYYNSRLSSLKQVKIYTLAKSLFDSIIDNNIKFKKIKIV